MSSSKKSPFGSLSRRRTASWATLPALASGGSGQAPTQSISTSTGALGVAGSPVASGLAMSSPRSRSSSATPSDDLASFPKLASVGKGSSQIEAQQILAMIADTIDEQVFKFHLVFLSNCGSGSGERLDKATKKSFSAVLKLCVKTAKELADTAQKMKKRYPAVAELEANLSKDIRQLVQELADAFADFCSGGDQSHDARQDITHIVESVRKLCRSLRANVSSVGSPGRRLAHNSRRSLLSSPSFGTMPVLRAKQDENCSKQGAVAVVEALCAMYDEFADEWAALEEESRSQFLAGLKIVLDDFSQTALSRSADRDRPSSAAKPQPRDLYLLYDRQRQCLYSPADEESSLLSQSLSPSSSSPSLSSSPSASSSSPSLAVSLPSSPRRRLQDTVTAACIEFIIGAHNIVWSSLAKDVARRQFLAAGQGFCSAVLSALDELPRPAAAGDNSESSAADAIESRLLQDVSGSVAALQSAIASETIKHCVAAVADAESVTRRGLLDQQLRRSIWIDSNSVRVHGVRINALLPYLEKPETRIELYCTVLTTCKDVKRFLKHVETFILIQQIQQTAAASDGGGQQVDDRNIWMEHSKKDAAKFYYATETKDDPKPTVASLNELILRLTSDINFERDYQDTFITTYRSFTEPHIIFRKMMERFQVPSGLFDRGRIKSIQLRVAVVVTNWMNTNFGDFDQILIEQLFTFGEQLRSLGFKSSGDSLLASLERKLQYQESYLHSTLSSPPVCFDVLHSNAYTPSGVIMASSEIEVARQLTLIDYAIFASIELSELLNLNWSSKSRAHRASNIRMMVRRLNHLSHWFSGMILWPMDPSSRAKVYTKVLKILVHLKELQNYNAVMGIVAGLNMAAVPRLKKTLALVDPKLLEQYRDIEKIMDPSGSYRNYREALSQCQGSVIPYLGVFLTDLTFIEEGNPDYIDGLINFGKRNLIFTILKVINTFQSNPYPFPPVEPLHSILFTLPHIQNDQIMFDLSLAREPREPRAS